MLVVVFYTFSDIDLQTINKWNGGWTAILLLGLCIAVNIFVIIIVTVRDLKRKLSACWSRCRRRREKKYTSQLTITESADQLFPESKRI